jgi:AcrR family transcriptional regulator
MGQARVIKERGVRRDELLDVAQQLFAEKGYEATPVNAIIDRAGVSKGTFYHYFPSKEELLDCLVGRTTDGVLLVARKAAASVTTGAAAKLSAFFLAASRWKAANREAVVALTSALFRDENILLRYKGTRRWLEAAVADMAGIIREGVAEGVFSACDPEETAQLILQLAVAMRESLAGLLLRLDEDPGVWPLLERRMRSYQLATERILGAPAGSIMLMDEETLNMLKGTKRARVRHEAARSAQTTLWPMPEGKGEE